MEDNADDPGVKCLRIDDNLSPAILNNVNTECALISDKELEVYLRKKSFWRNVWRDVGGDKGRALLASASLVLGSNPCRSQDFDDF
jgi:hypothetical protein